MNKSEWHSMSNAERYNYLSSKQPVVNKATGLNPNGKVNDEENAFITVHWVERGGVVTTEQFIDASKAILRDKEVMREWYFDARREL